MLRMGWCRRRFPYSGDAPFDRLLTSTSVYDGGMIAGWLLMGIGVVIAGPLSAQISGRVVANGGPPPEPVTVMVHCEGSATWDFAGYTDKRGEFVSFAPNGRAQV
jgi:hypothetical protein